MLFAKCSNVYFFLGTRALNVAVFRLETEPWLVFGMDAWGCLDADSGAVAEVGSATALVDIAQSLFVPSKFFELVSSFFPSPSSISVGFLSSSFCGDLLCGMGSSFKTAVVGWSFLRKDGVSGVRGKVFTSVSLLTFLESFTWGGCEPPLLRPTLPLVSGEDRPLVFFKGLIFSSTFTKCVRFLWCFSSLFTYKALLFFCFFMLLCWPAVHSIAAWFQQRLPSHWGEHLRLYLDGRGAPREPCEHPSSCQLAARASPSSFLTPALRHFSSVKHRLPHTNSQQR